MAVAPTGAIYKALSFDNVSSRTYGVYITGQAVYNAPTRDVEMISIPGRNGAFALDKGRFENIEVSYPAGIFADNETDFAEAISDFRNFLCSRNGYVRLTDEYNPNEYRMAIYKSGLEVSPAQLKAGEFEIVFDCKPQRWLTSGETAITVSSGNTVTNPTLFESSPMLEFDGYGKITLNGSDIELFHVPLGDVTLWAQNYGRSATSTTNPGQITKSFAIQKVATNDAMTLSTDEYAGYMVYFESSYFISNGYVYVPESITSSLTGTMPIYSNSIKIQATSADPRKYLGQHIDVSSMNFVCGTASSYNCQFTTTGNIKNTSTDTITAFEIRTTFLVSYDGNGTITYQWTYNIVNDTSGAIDFSTRNILSYSWGQLRANSSISAIGNPTYIDTEIGEAYMIDNGVYISLNNNVGLEAELPTLSPGNNTVTFDNTVTNFKIFPRWWKV